MKGLKKAKSVTFSSQSQNDDDGLKSTFFIFFSFMIFLWLFNSG